jgi:streptogramin lyase
MRLATWFRHLAHEATRSRVSRQSTRAALFVERLEERAVPSATGDSLYVGDNSGGVHSGNDGVQRFDASTGASQGEFVSGADSLKGVRGLIFDGAGHLLVANQDVFRGKPGEIMKFDAATGAFDGDLVSFQDADAPFAPRGICLKNNVLYVANLQDSGTTKAGIAPDGEIDRYDATTGAFLGDFSRPAGWTGQFNPRAVVFGPDGNLYASVFDSSNLSLGYVVKIDVSTGAESLFANESTTAPDMHRPEGLTFGPDGKLYVTGYRADASGTDKIVVLSPATGAEVSSIALDAVSQPRAYGQAMIFGPGGRLFMPISTLAVPDSGAVRSYDVSTGSFVNFEAPGTLGSGWYLTFGRTDPATLAYAGDAGDAAVLMALLGGDRTHGHQAGAPTV